MAKEQNRYSPLILYLPLTQQWDGQFHVPTCVHMGLEQKLPSLCKTYHTDIRVLWPSQSGAVGKFEILGTMF